MTEPAFRKLSEQEYLHLLEESDVRYEYVDGFMYAQAGTSNAHNIIAGNLQYALHPAAKTQGCLVYQSDMRLRILNTATGQLVYYFPDLMVSCEAGTRDPVTLFLTAPCLIIEILSRSTFREDKSAKWQNYQTLASLQAYLMVDSLSRSAAIYLRTEAGWKFEEVSEYINLPCVDLTVTLAEIYDGSGIH